MGKPKSINPDIINKVIIGKNAIVHLKAFISLPRFRDSRFFVLADSNTVKHCLPVLDKTGILTEDVKIIEIPAGEASKDIDVCKSLWLALSSLGADRNSVLINLGGGVISDIAGFVASTFMRGIRFINVPTSMLAMVDASVGGKTGIDLNGIKNMVGTFHHPMKVFIYPPFLRTLPENQLRSGFAEMIKHALIADEEMWHLLKKKPYGKIRNWLPLIRQAVEIKRSAVMADPLETGIRKVLNFGHTVGHAVETCSIRNGKRGLLHGEAIAIGMICEAYLSFKIIGLAEEILDDVCSYILSAFSWRPLPGSAEELIAIMKYDKKNSNEQICFTLLAGYGQVMINQQCSDRMIYECLDFYQNLDARSK